MAAATVNGKPKAEIEERHQQHAAADAEQRAETASDGAGHEDDRRQQQA